MKNTVNQRLKQLRTELGLSQTQFAVDSGLSLPGISKLENSDAEPSEKTLKAISKAFNANYDWLKTGKGEMFLKGGPPIQNESVNPYKDALVSELKEKNTFLEKQAEWMQTLISNLTGNPNFREAIDVLRVA